METLLELLSSLLRTALTGAPPPDETRASLPASAPALYALSARHDLAHLVAYAFERSGVPDDALPDNVAAAFRAKMRRAIWRTTRLDYAGDAICAALADASLDHILLKGSVLRADYPERWMRTGSDVDVLVRPADFDAAADCLCRAFGYRRGHATAHDVALLSKDWPLCELHHSLLELTRSAPAGALLRDVWQHAAPVSPGAPRYEMAPEFFCFYHVAHMADHFERGGCGIRPFVDLALMKRSGRYQPEAVRPLLEAGGLLPFGVACETLADVFLGEIPLRDCEKPLRAFAVYTAQGGVYGSLQNMVAASRAKEGSGAGYLRARLILPRDRLESMYPRLRNHPRLAPLYQLRRWCNVFAHPARQNYLRELKTARQTTPADQQALTNLRNYLHL